MILFLIFTLCNGILLNLLNIDLNCMLKIFKIFFPYFWQVDGSQVNWSCYVFQPKIVCSRVGRVGSGQPINPTGRVTVKIFLTQQVMYQIHIRLLTIRVGFNPTQTRPIDTNCQPYLEITKFSFLK